MTTPNPAYVAPTTEQVAEVIHEALCRADCDRGARPEDEDAAAAVLPLYAPLVAEVERLHREIADLARRGEQDGRGNAPDLARLLRQVLAGGDR